MSDRPDPADIAAFDQELADFVRGAELISKFHAQLVKEGMEQGLAALLTRDRLGYMNERWPIEEE